MAMGTIFFPEFLYWTGLSPLSWIQSDWVHEQWLWRMLRSNQCLIVWPSQWNIFVCNLTNGWFLTYQGNFTVSVTEIQKGL